MSGGHSAVGVRLLGAGLRDLRNHRPVLDPLASSPTCLQFVAAVPPLPKRHAVARSSVQCLSFGPLFAPTLWLGIGSPVHRALVSSRMISSGTFDLVLTAHPALVAGFDHLTLLALSKRLVAFVSSLGTPRVSSLSVEQWSQVSSSRCRPGSLLLRELSDCEAACGLDGSVASGEQGRHGGTAANMSVGRFLRLRTLAPVTCELRQCDYERRAPLSAWYWLYVASLPGGCAHCTCSCWPARQHLRCLRER